ncbi:MAG: hypothetical protein IJR98_05765 [Synergistaceae bacterium]|nr:hypothetical protein [Synergistaceae bacterium]
MYIDEAGFDSYLYRRHARAPRGEKIHEKVKERKYQRTSIVAGKMGANIIAPEEHLLPELAEDVTIILDNASFHRKKQLYEITQRHKRKIIFLLLAKENDS